MGAPVIISINLGHYRSSVIQIVYYNKKIKIIKTKDKIIVSTQRYREEKKHIASILQADFPPLSPENDFHWKMFYTALSWVE